VASEKCQPVEDFFNFQTQTLPEPQVLDFATASPPLDFEEFFKRQHSAQAVMQNPPVAEPLISLDFKVPESTSDKQKVE